MIWFRNHADSKQKSYEIRRMRIFAKCRKHSHFQGETLDIKYGAWNVSAFNCTTHKISELPFQQNLLRYGMICCARPRLKEAGYVVCILCTVKTLNTVYSGDVSSTYVCVCMPIHPTRTVTPDKREIPITFRQEDRTMTASNLQKINLNLSMNSTSCSIPRRTDWLTDRQL